MALVWQMYRLLVNLPNFSSCLSNEKICADDIATGEAARMSDTRDWTDAIVLTVDTRLRLPTEIAYS